MRDWFSLKPGSTCLINIDESDEPAAGAGEQASELYRAIGTEPYWSLTIGKGEIVYSPADGEEVRVAAPEPTWTRAGRSYEIPEMTVFINEFRRCRGADGREYPHTVSVEIGTQRVEGCGGTPEDEPTAG